VQTWPREVDTRLLHRVALHPPGHASPLKSSPPLNKHGFIQVASRQRSELPVALQAFIPRRGLVCPFHDCYPLLAWRFKSFFLSGGGVGVIFRSSPPFFFVSNFCANLAGLPVKIPYPPGLVAFRVFFRVRLSFPRVVACLNHGAPRLHFGFLGAAQTLVGHVLRVAAFRPV